MAEFFYIAIYQPLFNILIFFYNNTSFYDLGIAVILLTIIIKLCLHPLGIKAARSQKEMEAIQPEIKKIQEKYKKNKEEQSKKIMELYKSKKINPFAGIVPLFIQFPILISLFQIFRRGLEQEEMKHLYSFVKEPEFVNYYFLNIIDLSEPFIIFAIIAGAGQYLQMKIMVSKKKANQAGQEDEKSKSDIGKTIQSQMVYFLPGFTFFILLSLPSVVGLYWIVTIIFSILQQYIVQKENKEGEIDIKEPVKQNN